MAGAVALVVVVVFVVPALVLAGGAVVCRTLGATFSGPPEPPVA